MLLRAFVCLLFLCSSFRGLTQSRQVDSLQHLIRTLPNDTTKVFILNKLVEALRESDINKALRYGTEAKQLAELIDYKIGKAVALENLGWLHYRRGDYSKAFELSSDALKIFESEGNDSGKGRCIINIAALSFEQKQYASAINSFKNAFELSKKTHDYQLMARSLNNISYTLLTIRNIDSALVYAQKALKCSEQSNNAYMKGFSLRTIADIELERGNYKNVINLLEQVMALAKTQGNIFLEVSSFHRLGRAYHKLHQYDKAVNCLLENIKKAGSLGYMDELERSYKELSQVYASKNDLSKAFYYQSKYIAIHDSLYSQRSTEQMTVMQARFDSEMKEAKIQLLMKDAQFKEEEIIHQRLWIYFSIGCVSFLLILAAVLLHSNKVRKNINESLAAKNIEMQLQAQELRNLNITKDKLFSIISHDLRSPLASLRGLIDLVHSGDLSNGEFTEISKKVKRSLDSVNDDLDNLLLWAQSQLRGLQVNPETLYLKPIIQEKISLFKESAANKNISFVNDVDDDLIVFADKNHVSLVIRNLLANAIKFNKYGGSVIIKERDREEMVEISVEDTGVGMSITDSKKLFNAQTHFTHLGTNHEKGAGIGLLLTKEFIEKNGGAIWVTSELDKGTTFTFTLKRDFAMMKSQAV